MKAHFLKTRPEVFRAVKNGEKTAEFRRNDRDFIIGDVLILQEYLICHGVYTGEMIAVKVNHIMANQFNIPEGFCVMSVVRI